MGQRGSSPRATTQTIYDDAGTEIASPAGFNPLAAIIALAEAQLPRMEAWAARMSAPPLCQQAAAAQGNG